MKIILSQDFKDADQVQHYAGETIEMDMDTYEWHVAALQARGLPTPTLVSQTPSPVISLSQVKRVVAQMPDNTPEAA